MRWEEREEGYWRNGVGEVRREEEIDNKLYIDLN